MKYKLFIFLMIAVFFSSGFAQSQVMGRVLDAQTSQPLAGADVFLKKHKIGTTSDPDGFFNFSIPSDVSPTDTLIIHFVGYQIIAIPVQQVQKKHLYYLEPIRLQLDQPIQIQAERLNLSRLDIPHQTKAIEANEIERYATAELSTVLKNIPSVRLEGNEIDGKHLQIRGSNANEVNVYLDGILLNDLSSTNTADLSLVPVDRLAKIEIHKTAHMLLNGSGAFGGVLNLMTRQPSKFEAEIKARRGSFNSRQYFGSIGLPLGKHVTSSYFGQFAAMHPQIEFFPDEKLLKEKSTNDQIDQQKFNHYFNLNFQEPSLSLNWKMFYYGLKYRKPGWQDNRKTLIISNQNQFTSAVNFAINYMHSNDKVERYAVATSKDFYNYDAHQLNVRLFKTFQIKKGLLQAMGEYWHDRLKRKSAIQDSTTIYPLEDLFFYDNRISSSILYTFNERHDQLKNLNWQVYFGLRGDASASGYRDLSNAIGGVINWRKNNHQIQLLLSYGRNVKYPTLFDLAQNRDFTLYTLNDTTQKKLEPEYSQSFDLGFKMVSDYFSRILPQVEYEASFFYRTLYNKLLKQPFGEYLVQAQIGRNRTIGFEGSFKLNRLWGFTDIQAGFTRLYISDHLLYEFKPELRSNLLVNFLNRYFYLSMNYFYEGKSYGWYYDQLNRLRTTRLDGYSDMDVTLAIQTQNLPLNFLFQFSVYNLFDNAGYRYYYLNKRYLQLTIGIKY